MTVNITRTEFSSAELRLKSSRCKDANSARRLLAIAFVLDGHNRTDAARACGMDRQTLRDWVHRYNEFGVAGLVNKPHGGGSARRLTPEQEADIVEIVRKGPDMIVDGVVRWRRCDLARVIKERFNVDLAETSVGKMLRRLGFSHISARPRHPEADVERQAAHKKTLPSL